MVYTPLKNFNLWILEYFNWSISSVWNDMKKIEQTERLNPEELCNISNMLHKTFLQIYCTVKSFRTCVKLL